MPPPLINQAVLPSHRVKEGEGTGKSKIKGVRSRPCYGSSNIPPSGPGSYTPCLVSGDPK